MNTVHIIKDMYEILENVAAKRSRIECSLHNPALFVIKFRCDGWTWSSHHRLLTQAKFTPYGPMHTFNYLTLNTKELVVTENGYMLAPASIEGRTRILLRQRWIPCYRYLSTEDLGRFNPQTLQLIRSEIGLVVRGN